MKEFYKKIFRKYAKGKFPLTLLGRSGWMTFETKEELREFYENISKVEKETGLSYLKI